MNLAVQLSLLLLLLQLLQPIFALREGDITANAQARETCKPHRVGIQFCKDANMTHTKIPSKEQLMLQKSMTEMRQLLGAMKCAPFIDNLICSMTLPYCNEKMLLTVNTSRLFCDVTQFLCAPKLKEIKQKWPDALDCSKLEYSKFTEAKVAPDYKTYIRALTQLRQDEEELIQQVSDKMRNERQRSKLWQQPNPQPPKQETTQSPAKQCSQAEVKLGTSCSPRCHADLLFSSDDKQFAEVWMLLWSIICLASTALAFATFVMDSARFRYPERPMVWVAACCMLYSCGHLLRAALGPQVACGNVEAVGAASSNESAFLISRHAGQWCAVVFLILYFSSMAACMWWVVLTVCWYLCAAKKWAHEALEAKAMLLHSCAWGPALLLSVVLLVLHRIEGDELTHLCVVDGSDNFNTLVFVIVPMSACLLIGLCFLTCAMCSTISVRHNLKGNGDLNFRRLEKLLTKITLFSFLFGLPNFCVLAANIYEYTERDKWHSSLQKVMSNPSCVTANGLLATEDCRPLHRPSAALFMLKIFMALAVGLPSGLIVWFNCKSATAWHRCCCRVLLRKRKPQSPVPISGGSGGTNGWQTICSDQLLASSHAKYPPVPGLAASEV